NTLQRPVTVDPTLTFEEPLGAAT
ncbi:MAG: hypothetical protein QOI30_2293, partial [Mycobacterium sp.]|nr:hypothetical protein [Mycobacterium sp.]